MNSIKKIKYTIKKSKIFNGYNAKKMALTSKRLDICSAQFAHSFSLSNKNSIVGKNCLEIGGGWLLTHALVLHLIGAKKVIVVDVFPLANPKYLYDALNSSVISIIRDVLSPFDEHDKIRSRLDNLLSISKFDFNVLEDLGIYYKAPIDLSKIKLNDSVDFIYSNSVLEHVPLKDINNLIKNLSLLLKKDGFMLHCIHLEDHKSPTTPFDFLSINSKLYDSHNQTRRGNRLRCSNWINIFSNIDKTNSKLIYKWLRKDKPLPKFIDSSIKYIDKEDLRVSHIGILTEKK